MLLPFLSLPEQLDPHSEADLTTYSVSEKLQAPVQLLQLLTLLPHWDSEVQPPLLLLFPVWAVSATFSALDCPWAVGRATFRLVSSG